MSSKVILCSVLRVHPINQPKHSSRCSKSVECQAAQVLSVFVWHFGKGTKIYLPSKSPKVAGEFLKEMTIEYLKPVRGVNESQHASFLSSLFGNRVSL